MKAKFLAWAIVLGMVSVSPALGGSVLYTVTGTFTHTMQDDTEGLGGASFQITLEIDSAAAGTPITTLGVRYLPGDFTIAESVISGSSGIFEGPLEIVSFDIFGDVACCSLVWEVESAGGEILRMDIVFMPATLWSGSAPTDPLGIGVADIDPVVGGAESTTLGIYDLNVRTLSVTTVPEPATLALLSLGLLAGAAVEFRKRFK